MKFRLSLPTNQEKFNDYARLYKLLSSASWLCQVISSLTTIGIVYAYFYTKLADFLSPNYAHIATISIALLISGAIEALSRICTQESVKAIFKKRFKKAELLITILMFLGAIGALTASGFISFYGGKDTGSSFVGEAQLQTTDKTDSIYLAEKKEITSKYRQDSTTLANTYQTKIKAVPSKYQGEINVLSSQIKNASPESTKWIISLKNQRQGLIDQRKADQSTLKIELSDKLTTLLEVQTTELSNAKGDKQTTTDEINTINKEEKEKNKSKKLLIGYGVGWFTVAVLLLFVVCIVVVENIKHLCGMNEQVSVSSYYFSPSIWSELKQAISDRFNYYIRLVISKIHKSTPPPPLPNQSVLYDYNMLPNTIKLNFQNQQQTLNIPSNVNFRPNGQNTNVNIEEIAIQYLQAAEQLKGLKLENEALQMDLKANEVIRHHIGVDTAEAQILEFKGQILGYLQGKNDNPFTIQKNNPIGYKIGGNNAANLDTKMGVKTSPNDLVHQAVITDELGKIELQIMKYQGRIEASKKRLLKLKQKSKVAETQKALKNQERNLYNWEAKKQAILNQVSITSKTPNP